MTYLVFSDDIYFHLEKADEHLRNAESKLLLQDVQLAKMVRALREDLRGIIGIVEEGGV